MKETKLRKSLLAIAVMAAAGTASAQSSVTLFGIIDNAVTWGRGEGPGSSNRVQLTNSAYNTSRLGFRGSEDLGGGLSASFWLEGAVLSDDGRGGSAIAAGNQATTVAAGSGFNFGRRSTVSLSGSWGELRLGRDYTPQFWSVTAFDPFGGNGVGTTQVHAATIAGPTQLRASNTVGYLLPPKLGGLYGQAQIYLGENPSSAGATRRDGSGGGIRIGYASGPFNVAVATGYTRFAAGGVHQSNIGGQWDFGMARLMGAYERDRNGSTEARGWVAGTLIPVGAGEVRLAYSRYAIDTPAGADPRTAKIALGYVHNLSKRTAVYGTIARVRNSGGSTFALGGATTAANTASSGADLGIRHSF